MSKMITKFRKDRDYSDDFNNSKKYYAAKKNNNGSSVDRKIKLRQYQENESYYGDSDEEYSEEDYYPRR